MQCWRTPTTLTFSSKFYDIHIHLRRLALSYDAIFQPICKEKVADLLRNPTKCLCWNRKKKSVYKNNKNSYRTGKKSRRLFHCEKWFCLRTYGLFFCHLMCVVYQFPPILFRDRKHLRKYVGLSNPGILSLSYWK